MIETNVLKGTCCKRIEGLADFYVIVGKAMHAAVPISSFPKNWACFSEILLVERMALLLRQDAEHTVAARALRFGDRRSAHAVEPVNGYRIRAL